MQIFELLGQLADSRDDAGNHRDPVLGGDQAQMVFTDPPYNVPIAGHVGGTGAIRHREFVMASGEMSPDRFTAFLETVFANLAAHSTDGAIHFVCMDWPIGQRSRP